MELSEQFGKALQFAASAHHLQTRKGSGAPFITHSLAVCALVGQYGGNEAQMIAALLHDVLERTDTCTRRELEQRFGKQVARIVAECTEPSAQRVRVWRERKQRLLDQLQAAGPDVRLVAAADKLSNARSILADLRTVGSGVWSRFSVGPDEVLWYFRAALDSLRDGWHHPLIEELERTVTEIERLKGASHVG